MEVACQAVQSGFALIPCDGLSTDQIQTQLNAALSAASLDGVCPDVTLCGVALGGSGEFCIC